MIRRRGRQRVVRQQLATAAVAVLVAGGLVGSWWGLPAPRPDISVPSTPTAPAGGPSPSQSSPAASPPPATRPTNPAPEASATRTPPGGSSPATVPCRAPRIVVSTGGYHAASGHRALVLLFTNQSSTPCHVKGYPGVAGLDATGTQVVQAQRSLRGYMGGTSSIETVLIQPGQTASARVEALAFNPGDGSACNPWAELLVTVPDDTVSTRLPWTSDGCAQLEVHPVVPGGTGLGP